MVERHSLMHNHNHLLEDVPHASGYHLIEVIRQSTPHAVLFSEPPFPIAYLTAYLRNICCYQNRFLSVRSFGIGLFEIAAPLGWRKRHESATVSPLLVRTCVLV
jgi:hypothetical protein